MEAPYFGKIAWIDLTSEEVSFIRLDEKVYSKVIGGKGLGVYLLLRYLVPGTAALSPDNIIVLANGPFTNSGYPSASRMELVTLSPLTGTFLDSNAGGYLGRETKASGLDAIVISGASKKPVYLFIKDDHVEFKDAAHFWGLGTTKTEEHIKNELGDKSIQVLSIGLAGENQVLLANVTTGKRHFGRGGAGAVFGSKNLKAIAVRGARSLPWVQDPGFKKLTKKARGLIRDNSMTGPGKAFPTMGTHMTIEVVNYFGVFPSLNWKNGTFPPVNGIWPDHFSASKVRKLGCNGCPISCKRLVKAELEGGALLHDGPEYESIYALGACCGVSSSDAVIMLDNLCTEHGLDSISTGVTISFIMECYARGFVTKRDLDGLELSFGRHEEMAAMIDKIARREGAGELLSGGASKAAAQVGEGSADFAMAVKGLELPGYDPRGMKTMALMYALGDRGGCHVRGSTLKTELLGLPEPLDRFSLKGKAPLAARLHKEYALLNSFSVCLFANFALGFDEYTEAANYLFKQNWTPEKLKETGSFIWNLTRVFNCREGFTSEDDTLPMRLFKEPLPDGISKGHVIDPLEFNSALQEYYSLQKWNNNGIPTLELLKRQGIEELLAEDMFRDGVV